MDKFTCVQDIGDLRTAVAEALEIKRDRLRFAELGRNRTLLMLFFNSSLRTRLSTQKAAMNLGMNVMVLDVNQGAWKLETERGVVMDGDKAAHLLEAIPVMGSYCDVIGVRSFARFADKAEDYEERVLEQFIRHSGRPVFSMEAATRHPLQSFADLITIEEHKRTERPKVVMTWAPHPNALPQAVPNSFAEWMNAAGYDFVITHPGGYGLAPGSAARPASSTTSAARSRGPTSSTRRTGRHMPTPTTARCSRATARGRSTPRRWPSRTMPTSCTACPCGAT